MKYYKYFFNEYGYKPPIGFETGKQQLEKAGVDVDGCHMFKDGYGNCSNDGFSQADYNGVYMSRNQQLKDSGVNYEYSMTFGKGFDSEGSGGGKSCLTFKANTAGSSLYFYDNYYSYEPPVFEYSRDNGHTWQTYLFDNGVGQTIELIDNNQAVMFRGMNNGFGGNYQICCSMTGSISASGDVTSLINGVGGDAPLNPNCFCNMFQYCESLTTAPNLPSTTLAENCYEGMFSGCTSLTTAPVLQATTLDYACYHYMFSGCTSLTTLPQNMLPATTLADYCYQSMFQNCESLTTAPALPATTLAESCYDSMFANCTSLTTAPSVLPATTLANNCYNSMFICCTSLTTAPALQATTLDYACYQYMFYGCTSLETAPALQATTLAENCYYGMFSGCTSLETAPSVLPATTLDYACYQYMFSGCTLLTTAPELPAETLVNGCYSYMFNGCTSLNYIKALFTTEPSTTYTNNWVNGVASSGTFIRNKNATWYVEGVNGIPENWTLYNDDGTPVVPNYLKFTAEVANSTIKIYKDGYLAPSLSLKYSLNGGSWMNYTVGSTITLSSIGNHVRFKGENGRTCSDSNTSYYNRFVITGKMAASGDITSILNSFGGDVSLNGSSYCFSSLFLSCTGLTTAPNLPSTTLADYCYNSMFYGCTSLETAPALPATTLANYCYQYMFQGCTLLTTAPALPATTLADYCYYYMFYGCTSLETAPALPATTLDNYCYSYMFYGCTSLETAPALPATTLAGYCYSNMFQGCTSLTTAPALPATTLGGYCYSNMFYGCTSLTTAPELPAATLANYCYQYMFRDCTGLTTAPALQATTLGQGCYNNMFQGCTSLTTAPALPSTTLVNNCYAGMFSGCTSLTTAPELSATTLVEGCYSYMFSGCSSLNYIKALFTIVPSNTCTSNWVNNVAINGTFIRNKNSQWYNEGNCGIPETWSIYNDDLTNVEKQTSVITIGSGSSTNSYIPCYAYYKYSLTEQIYTSEEIGQYGAITSIAFKVAGSYSQTRKIDLFFKETNKTIFEAKNDWVALNTNDRVYSGNVTFETDWKTITLDSSFFYNGTNNLIVGVDDNTGTNVESTSQSPKFNVYATGTNRTLRIYGDNSNYSPWAPGSYNGSYITSNDQIQLTIKYLTNVVE